MKRKMLLAVSLLLAMLVFCGCTVEWKTNVSGKVVGMTAQGYLVLLEGRDREALCCETVFLKKEELGKQIRRLHIGDKLQLEYSRSEGSGGWQLRGLWEAPREENRCAGAAKK